MVKMNIVKLIDKVKNQDDNEDKVKILQANNDKMVEWLVESLYNIDYSNLKMPEYTRSKDRVGESVTTLWRSLARVKLAHRLVETDPERSEAVLIDVLENVSGEEADLLETVITGKKVDGISKAVWKKSFPQFFRSEESSNEGEKA